MKAAGFKMTWSLAGKLIAGAAMIVLSFLVFKTTPGWVKIIVLAVLVLILIAPQQLMKKKLPPEVEKALKKPEDRKGGYG